MSRAQEPPNPVERRSTDRRRGAVDASDFKQAAQPGLLDGAVAFRLRRLEPLVAWVLAAYTVWIAVLQSPGGAGWWLIALFAASIAGWCRVYPARVQASMLLRGVLLLMGGLLLHTAASGQVAADLLFFWPLVVSVFYALLLTKPWAELLSALAVSAFSLGCWSVWPAIPWPLALGYAAILVLAPGLGIAFGSAMRASEERTESSLRDGRTLLYNETGFFVHGAVLLAECRQKARPFCMALLNAADLNDIRDLLGRKVANDLFTQVVQSINRVQGAGLAARIDVVEFALLLPGVTVDQAGKLIQQQLGTQPKVEVKIGNRTVAIGLDLIVAQAHDKGQTLEELYDALHSRWAQIPAQAEPATNSKRPLLDERPQGAHRATNPTVPMPLRAENGSGKPQAKRT